MKRKSILLALASVLAIGCGGAKADYKKNQDVTTYGIVHKQYLGEFVVKTDKKGKLESVKFDEVFLPHHWAAIPEIDDIPVGVTAINIKYDTRNGGAVSNHYFAKHIRVNNEVFILDVTALPALAEGSDVYRIGDFAALSLYKNAAGTKALTKTAATGVAALYNDDVWLKEYVAAYDIAFQDVQTTVEPKMGFLSGTSDFAIVKDAKGNTPKIGYEYGRKTEGHYWPVSATALLGWQGNMDAIQAHIMANGFAELDKAAKNTDGKWAVTIDGTAYATAATLTDFVEYAKVALKAYELIKA